MSDQKTKKKSKKKLSWAELKRQMSQTSNKDKIFSGVCFAICIGLAIWFIFFHLM